MLNRVIGALNNKYLIAVVMLLVVVAFVRRIANR
jgi:hypothetical protein